MHYTHALALVAGYLASNAHALPKPNPAATYSVVDVGGPSTEPANTVYATVTAPSRPETETQSSTPQTVTEEHTVTVASPVEPTATKSWTVTIGGTEVTTTVSESVATPTVVVAETETVYYPAPPAVPMTTSTSCSSSSTTPKSAFPSVISHWNHTVSAIPKPTATGSYKHHSSGIAHISSGFEKRWAAATAQTGYGALGAQQWEKRFAGLTATGANKRAADPTATGGYVAERAIPTGYGIPSWNSTDSHL